MPVEIFGFGICEDGTPPAPVTVRQIADLARHGSPVQRRRDVMRGIDPRKLKEAGWGILFAQADEKADAIRKALKPLLELRKKQAGESRYREYAGDQGYAEFMRDLDFLARQQQGPGPIDPNLVPYYLLVVGDPARIPYRFQYQLDVPCAVGRLSFDTVEEYAAYARNVVEVETRGASLPRRVALFGACHPNDPPTVDSSKRLLGPLEIELNKREDWEVRTYLGGHATKARLGSLMGGEETPALLFTAGHGLLLDSGHVRQKSRQGALVCQEWQGHGHRLLPEVYFAAEDLSPEAGPRGLISFHFACFSAGTPEIDEFSHIRNGSPSPSAPEAFVACLPQKMLAHPKGGALAVIGHVDQAWACSFLWPEAGSQIRPFADVLHYLLDGWPVGAAMEPMNQRYAQLAAALGSLREKDRLGTPVPDEELARLWTAANDARNYVILGDPAVKLSAKD